MTTWSSPREAIARAYASDAAVRLYAVCGLLLGAFAATQCPPGRLAAGCLAGWAVYLVEEYLSHVLVFHGFVPRGAWLYRLAYRLHLGHHDRPRRLDLLFTPLWYTLPALLLNLAVFLAVTREPARAAALATGLVAGYLVFEWCHLVVHSPVEPGPVLRHVRRQHMGHHHWNERRWFTISPPALLLDVLFRTAGRVQDAPRSGRPGTVGLAPDDVRLLAARQRYRDRSDWTEHASAIWNPASYRRPATPSPEPGHPHA